MSMGIGTNARKPDEGKLKRDSLCEIACGVWFTSTGTANAQDDQIGGKERDQYVYLLHRPDPCADAGEEVLLRYPHP